MKMTDSEKIELIDMMTADFWDFLTEEQQEKNAVAFVVSIQSVVNFKGKDKKNAEG
jgi:hypothetical protein